MCADVGSTYTKVAVVDLAMGRLAGTSEHRTTVESDVLEGLDAAIAATGFPDVSTTYVCSSAGGGLRVAVVGYEQLVTAEAGHRVALSAGARVVHVAHGRLDRSSVAALRADAPDVVLLVGGTDGGDDEVLRHNADQLAAARLARPVVVAGNVDARDAVVARLGPRAVPADNVLPRIGTLNPGPARAAIREVFLRHVIGGKRLSRGPRFASLVRGATPDIVLMGVELLADTIEGDLLVVDVGGATTDVYSALAPRDVRSSDVASSDVASSDVAGMLWRSRTVEGDLGMRWSAPGVVTAAVAERILPGPSESVHAESLFAAARARAEDPAFLPTTEAERATELRLAELAATIAVRRHARGRDLSHVRLLIGSGGVLRHMPGSSGVLGAVLADHAGGWALPRAASTLVDHDYVLAPAGLLASTHRDAATALLVRMVQGLG